MIDCMQSFNIRIGQNTIVSSSNGLCRSWGTAGQYFFSCSFAPNGLNSVFNFTGFKNVDIYGVTLAGGVKGNPGDLTKCCVVQDWYFGFTLDGNPPLVSGSKGSPDGWGIVTQGSNLGYFNLSKHTSQLIFANPWQSVKLISFDALNVQGVGAQFLNEVALNYNLDFTFYYKYEGEE